MSDEQLREIKEETAQLVTRLDNVEGYFDNFGTTLNNHMIEYAERQKEISTKQEKLSADLHQLALEVAKIQGSEGIAIILIKFVILPLIFILAGLIGLKLFLPALM